jgi:hypothetical protein
MHLLHASPSRGEQGYPRIKCEVTRWSSDKPKGRFGVTFLVRHPLLYGVLGGIMIIFPPKTLPLLPFFISTSSCQKQKRERRKTFSCHQRRSSFLQPNSPPIFVGKRLPSPSESTILVSFPHVSDFSTPVLSDFSRFSVLFIFHFSSWVSTVKPQFQ